MELGRAQRVGDRQHGDRTSAGGDWQAGGAVQDEPVPVNGLAGEGQAGNRDSSAGNAICASSRASGACTAPELVACCLTCSSWSFSCGPVVLVDHTAEHFPSLHGLWVPKTCATWPDAPLTAGCSAPRLPGVG